MNARIPAVTQSCGDAEGLFEHKIYSAPLRLCVVVDMRHVMNEHDDDLEPDVEEDAEFETEEFPILEDEDVSEGENVDEEDLDIDPDESELSCPP